MISVLIPAYNEVERIEHTLNAVRSLQVENHTFEIIVVDDGSRDSTAAAAEKSGADTVIRQANQGKGAALRTAYVHSRGEILMLLDADLGATASEASLLLAPLLKREADMTIATFPVIAGKGGGAGLVVRAARQGILALTGQEMTTPLSGQRALLREIIEKTGDFESGWGAEIALTVRALQAGYRVHEVPTRMSHRVTGRSWKDVLHRAEQFLAARWVLLKLRRESSRTRTDTRSSNVQGDSTRERK